MAVEFLKPLMSAEQAEQLDVSKLKEFEKDQEYVWAKDGSRLLPTFSSRAIYQRLKAAYYGRAIGRKKTS
jgi:hypothetical protein